MVVEDITEDLVPATEEREEEREQGRGRDHLSVAQEHQGRDHGTTELSIENLVVLGQEGNDLVREFLCVFGVAGRDLLHAIREEKKLQKRY